MGPNYKLDSVAARYRLTMLGVGRISVLPGYNISTSKLFKQKIKNLFLKNVGLQLGGIKSHHTHHTARRFIEHNSSFFT